MSRNKRFSNFNEDGVLSVEAIGTVLFYLIMLSVVAGALYMLFNNSKVGQMQQALTMISTQIQGLYSGSSSYSGLDNALALKAGVIPKKLVKGTGIQTPWGGAITIATGADASTFTIKLAGIAAEDCTKLAVYQVEMWDSIDVNGKSFSSQSNVSDIIGACASNSTITFQGR